MATVGNPPHQGLYRHAFVKVVVDGEDVTSRMDPYLLSVIVRDKENETDECSIELDDRDAKLAIPPDRASILVYLGWEPRGPRVPPVPPDPTSGTDVQELAWAGGLFLVFTGAVDTVESAFSRKGGGRKLFIEAKGWFTQEHAKSGQQMSMGTGVGGSPITMETWLKSVGKAIGIDVQLSPKMAEIQRNFWHLGSNESFMAHGAKLANEFGGIFKISGRTASMTSLLDSLDTSGNPFGSITAKWGVNLMQWRIFPFIGRPQAKNTKGDFFHQWLGEWKDFVTNIPGSTPYGNSSARFALPAPAPNEQSASQQNDGVVADSINKRGTGWCIINGNPMALAGRTLLIEGARPGVDGAYTISEAEHTYVRQGGYTTRCTLRRPVPQTDPGYRHWLQTQPAGAAGAAAGAGTAGAAAGAEAVPAAAQQPWEPGPEQAAEAAGAENTPNVGD